MTRSSIFFGVAAIVAIAGLGLYFWPGKTAGINKEIAAERLVGGEFSLLNHHEQRVSNETFQGKYKLVYFGYTSCAEICGLNLASISAAMEKLGPISKDVIPLFISIDSERDTVAQMAEYLEYFDHRIIGLTGTVDELSTVAKTYRVFYEEYYNDAAEQIDFNHSALTFLMGPDGEYLAHFPDGVEPSTIVTTIVSKIKLLEPQREMPDLLN